MIEQENRPDRSERKRVPMHQRNRLSYKEIPGYKLRWINDVDGRIQAAKEAGYDFVKSDTNGGDPIVSEGTKIGSSVSKNVGHGVRAHLMAIKKEWYEEDQKEKQKIVDASEQAMRPNKQKHEYGPGLENENLRE